MKRWALLAVLFLPALLEAQTAAAGGAATISDILQHFLDQHLSWLRTAELFGTILFGSLSVIEMCISFGMMMFSNADITMWTAEIMRRSFLIGVFYTLLTLLPELAQDAISMYVDLGERASGIRGGISATNIMADGLNISLRFLLNAIRTAGTLSFLTSLVLAGSALAVLWCFFRLVKAFAMAKVESYVTISVAAIQIAWGGFRYTTNFAERYIGGAIANGVRLMAITLLVGMERALAAGWIRAAGQVGNFGGLSMGGGLITLLALTCSICLFCAFADIEKWTSALFGGVPSFTSHDLTNTYTPYVSGAMTAAAGAASLGMTVAFPPGGAAGLLTGAARYAGAGLQVGSFAGGGAGRTFHMPPAASPAPAPPRFLPPPSRP